MEDPTCIRRESLDEAALRKSLETLFQTMFKRFPDEAALSYYTERYKSGIDLGNIVLELAGSEEYKTWARNRLFVPPGHFYSPIVDKFEATTYFDRERGAPVPDAIAGVTVDRSALLDLWNKLVPLMHDNPFPAEKSEDFRYYFGNPNFSYGDGSVWHAMLRYLKPKRVIEIGSGYSSANLIDTIERYFDHDVELTFVEPFPELLRNLIGDAPGRARILPNPVQDCDLGVFRALEAGDILFIDSTHVLRTGSDVCFELFEILPVLADGVIVHIHDMFWPFEYPEQWVIDDNRSWNELYAVRALLTGNPEWKVIMFNDYIAKTAKDLVENTYPIFLNNPGGGLYLEKRAPA
ncbi:class I SAM-dependent methyltransferase [Rhizobium sp. BK661]|uniref:class I SAM-dependent methyltransferase n=1 Tax=Rhizobium sp. BK661 TaxID=2586991 RepID=UPI002168D794|nr:class I SAM-dependent methyltransferase [Rhizobium sp. BK661]MCS3744337.1 hypothetical protein [Rhizobium sp. BK661]